MLSEEQILAEKVRLEKLFFFLRDSQYAACNCKRHICLVCGVAGSTLTLRWVLQRPDSKISSASILNALDDKTRIKFFRAHGPWPVI